MKSYDDVVQNLEFTKADGLMSAEGLLDDPALYYPSIDGITSSFIPSKIQLAFEYIELVKIYKVSIKTIIFHIRRIIRNELIKYQLIDEILIQLTIEDIENILNKIIKYEKSIDTFFFDKIKEKNENEKKKINENKRIEYEKRMIRKAKRENKDINYYLINGIELPNENEMIELKTMSKEQSFEIWKNKYSQNCYNYHFLKEKCCREATCGFIHTDISSSYGDAIAFG